MVKATVHANRHHPFRQKILNPFPPLGHPPLPPRQFLAQGAFHLHRHLPVYLIIAISNFMKLMFFSWAYILLCLGFEKLLPPCRAPHPDTEENP